MYRQVVKKGLGQSSSMLPNVVMLGGGVIGIGAYLKATVLLKSYSRMIQLCSNDEPVEPSVKLENMVIEVCNDLSKSISEHLNIRPVLIPGTHATHAGTFGTQQGGIIGLPSFFESSKIEEIDGKIQWDETSATDVEEIYNAFLLSNEAKKYSIAREILLVNTFQVYIDMVLCIAIPFLIDKIATNAKIQSEMVKLPARSRNFYYVMIVVVGVLIWRSLHMNLHRYYENKAEKTISQLGDSYIKGAIEYNKKIIQRSLCSATTKDRKNRVIKNISDSMKRIFSAKELPSLKVRFYQSLTVDIDEIKNDN